MFPHFLLHLPLLHLLRRSQHRRTEKTENFGDLITADHTILRKESEPRNNYRYVVVVQDLPTQWSQSCPCETKTSQETRKNLKYLEPTRKPKVIHTDNSLEFTKSCEDLSRNHCTSTQIRNKWDCQESSAQNQGRDIFSVVAVRSGRMVDGICGMLLFFCETFKMSCLRGRHHMKGGSECLLTDQ